MGPSLADRVQRFTYNAAERVLQLSQYRSIERKSTEMWKGEGNSNDNQERTLKKEEMLESDARASNAQPGAPQKKAVVCETQTEVQQKQH